jgi:large subunit ribosomal protein L25
MSKIEIQAEPRTVIGKRVNALRREGILPAVIYGNNVETMVISLDFREASKILAGLTSSSLVEIKLKGKTHTVIVREKQMNFIRDEIIHVDFQEVSLTEKLRASVGVRTEGESPAVDEYDAMLVIGLSEIEVEAFPQDLPEEFLVDISGLKEIGDSITVKDIPALENVEILSDPDEMLILVTSTFNAEEPSGEEGEGELAEGEEPEVIEKGKKEDESED